MSSTSTHAPTDEMEKPPKFTRRVELKRGQFAAFLLMATIPLLAVLRVFGDRDQTVEAAAGELTMNVQAPKLARYGNPVQVRLKVASDGATSAGERRLRIELAESYLERFSDVSPRPEFQGSTDGNETLTSNLAGGKHELEVTIDLTPEKYGWAEGKARAVLDTGGSVELVWSTFVFP